MAITLPRLSKCCFCLSLRTGSLIIGYVSIVISLLFMASISYFLYVVVTFVNQDHPNLEHSPEELARVALGVYVSQAYYLLVFLILAIISIMMVVGVHKDKPHLLKYYVYCAFFLLLLATILVVVVYVFVGFIATIPLLKWCVTHFLCILVVHSTRLDMEEPNKPPAYEMQNLYSPPAPVELANQ